jgi:ABC-2 type transport system ATP-binding protein
VIKVEGLMKIYGGTRALSGMSFEVQPGEIFGFVGPNGAGKTTTLRILATLLAPNSGSAVIDGVDVVANPYAVRGRIGYMPDYFGVYDQLTTAEYLTFYANCYRVPRARWNKIVGDLLELIGLEEKRDAQVNSLSRGMKQRLCLARALVHDPQVLLLDEPASGLDPRARVEMRELLRELKQMGKTIVISSHILPELAELCTTFGIVDHGRMVAYGPLESLMAATGRPRVRIKVRGEVEPAAMAAQGVAGVTHVGIDGDTLDVEYEPGTVEPPAILTALVSVGIVVAAFTPVEQDLEEAFLRVTEDRGPT